MAGAEAKGPRETGTEGPKYEGTRAGFWVQEAAPAAQYKIQN
jgi:hypothetical protein